MLSEIVIPLSKNKLTLLFIGAIIFILLGFWFVFAPPSINNPILGDPVLIFCVGIVSIIFFGVGAVFIGKKVASNKPGLIISNEGITDNSSGTAVGFIPWIEIKRITQTMVANQRFLILIVTDPEKYVQREKGIKKKFMQMNYNSYGSPITISASALKYNFNELYSIIMEKFNKHKP